MTVLYTFALLVTLHPTALAQEAHTGPRPTAHATKAQAPEEREEQRNERRSESRRRGPAAHADQGHGEVEMPTEAVAVLIPTKGNEVKGAVILKQEDDGVHLTGKVSGLKPGLHGFHIHEFGDLRSEDGKSAGAHFSPNNAPHAGPDDPQRHAGDLGNIEADENGEAKIDIRAEGLELHYVIGRSIVVHANPDDFKSQPAGDAGDRVAVGVIGFAEVEQRESEAATGENDRSARRARPRNE